MRIHIDDLLYGPVSLDDPLLIDLYHSKAVQRLSGIYQAGITAFINPIRRTTRLDHSLGVTALLQRLGADVVEQAGPMGITVRNPQLAPHLAQPESQNPQIWRPRAE
jgi:HD superfamily phosphohydrolase